MPLPDKLEKQAVFFPRAVPGVFVGYLCRPGRRWKGDFLCIPLACFANASLTADGAKESLHPQTTREVSLPPGDVVFPLKARYDTANRSLAANPDVHGLVGDVSPEVS